MQTQIFTFKRFRLGRRAGGPMDTLINMIPKLIAVIVIIFVGSTLTAKAMQPIDPAYNSEKIKECNERWISSLGAEQTENDDLDKDGVIDYCDLCVIDPARVATAASSLSQVNLRFKDAGISKNFLTGAPNDKDRDSLIDGCDSSITKKIDTLKYLGSFDRALEAECRKVAAILKVPSAELVNVIDKGEGITKCQIRKSR